MAIKLGRLRRFVVAAVICVITRSSIAGTVTILSMRILSHTLGSGREPVVHIPVQIVYCVPMHAF